MPRSLIIHIQPGNREVEIDHPELLKQRSVVLRDEIRRATDGRAITLTAHNPVTSVHSLEYVLESLQHDFADPGGDNCDAQALAEVCNVLMELQCDPRPFQGLWDKVHPRSSLEPLPSSNNPRSSQRSLEESRTSSSDGVEGARCWRTRLPTHARNTAGRLAIAALVLGQREALELELSIVVWVDTELQTSISELSGLDATRLKEKKAIFQILKDEVTRLLLHRDTAMERAGKDIAQKLQAKGLGDMSQDWEYNLMIHPNLQIWNPYRLIREYEKAIKPPDLTPQATHSNNPTHGYHNDPRYGPRMDGIGDAFERGFNRIFRRASGMDSYAATVEEILDKVETKIKINQRSLAEKVMNKRNGTVAGWLAELQVGVAPPRRPPRNGAPVREHDDDWGRYRDAHLGDARQLNGYR